MRKRTRSPIESPWFHHAVILIASVGVGLPLTIALLMSAGKDAGKIAFALTPFLTCIFTGYLIILVGRWLSRSL